MSWNSNVIIINDENVRVGQDADDHIVVWNQCNHYVSMDKTPSKYVNVTDKTVEEITKWKVYRRSEFELKIISFSDIPPIAPTHQFTKF